MKKKDKPSTDEDSIGTPEEEMLKILERELEVTIKAYSDLLKKCVSLAGFMSYKEDYVIGKVMPRNISDRTDTNRIRVWFKEIQEEVVKHALHRYWESKKEAERKKLIDSLNLTPEQKAILNLE